MKLLLLLIGTFFVPTIFSFAPKCNINMLNHSDIHQLVFETSKVDYSLTSTIKFNDLHPEIIIFKGMIHFDKFIYNLSNNKGKKNKYIPIKWIEPKNDEIFQNENTQKSFLEKLNELTGYSDVKTNKNIKSTKNLTEKINLTTEKTISNKKIIKNLILLKNFELTDSLHKILLVFIFTVSEIINLLNKK